jgi:hypothetical protein
MPACRPRKINEKFGIPLGTDLYFYFEKAIAVMEA